MNQNVCRILSTVCFHGGLISILLSIGTWWYLQGVPDGNQAYAERFGIFVGLWAPTLLILSNRFDRFADQAKAIPGLDPRNHEEENEEEADSVA